MIKNNTPRRHIEGKPRRCVLNSQKQSINLTPYLTNITKIHIQHFLTDGFK